MAIDYECPCCGSGDLAFEGALHNNFNFHCNFCGRDFPVKDEEEGYLPKVFDDLRERYPERKLSTVNQGLKKEV